MPRIFLSQTFTAEPSHDAAESHSGTLTVAAGSHSFSLQDVKSTINKKCGSFWSFRELLYKIHHWIYSLWTLKALKWRQSKYKDSSLDKTLAVTLSVMVTVE